ncbi:MAG: O-antigen ligase family protein [Chloroflexota bacterium]
MNLHLSHSYHSLSLLEPVWVLGALLLLAVAPAHTGAIAIGLALLCLSFLQRRVMTGHFSRSTSLDVAWLLLLVGAAIALTASYDPRLGLPALLALLGSIALYYAAANTSRPEALAGAALLAGLIVAVYYLGQYRFIPHAEKSGLASTLGHITSGFWPRLGTWQPFSNSVATLLEGLIPLGVGLALAGSSRTWRALGATAASLMALAVVVTASRGAWLALLAAATLWLAARRKVTFVALGLVILGLVALAGYLTLKEGATLASAPLVGPVWLDLFARPDRLQVYQGSLRLIQDFALSGIGLGDVFGQLYSQYVLLIRHVYLTYSHNLYLAVWLRHGILGAAGLGWLIVSLAWSVIREKQRAAAPLFEAAWVGAAAVLIHGLFDARPYVDLWSGWPLFLTLGLTVSTGTVAKIEATTGPSNPRWLWATLGALVLGLALTWRPLTGAVCTNLGAVQQAQAELAPNLAPEARASRLQAAVNSYQLALKFDPDNRTAHLRLGNLAVAGGRYAEGAAHLEVVWQATPADATARKALGLAYAWAGRIEPASALLRNSQDIVAELNTWGWWHSQEGRYDVAAHAYRTSLALEPEQPQIKELLNNLDAQETKD